MLKLECRVLRLVLTLQELYKIIKGARKVSVEFTTSILNKKAAIFHQKPHSKYTGELISMLYTNRIIFFNPLSANPTKRSPGLTILWGWHLKG